MLINLVANSLKFTFQGYIKIQLEDSLFENQRAVKFIIEDTGIGIDKNSQSKLFRLFSMITSEINPHGCGIGLTVSKKYVELLGGTIHLKSELNVGTTVSFYIPIEQPDSCMKITQIPSNRIFLEES